MVHVVFHYKETKSTYAFNRVDFLPGRIVFNEDQSLSLVPSIDSWKATPGLIQYTGRLINAVESVSVR